MIEESRRVSCGGGKTHKLLEFLKARFLGAGVFVATFLIACEPNCAAHFIAAVFHQLCSYAMQRSFIY
jgi:hypothetical protein